VPAKAIVGLVSAIGLLGLAGWGCRSKATPTPAIVAQGGTISGRVRWKEGGGPVAGAMVVAHSTEPFSEPQFTTTDDAGRYTISGLDPGECKVSAVPPPPAEAVGQAAREAARLDAGTARVASLRIVPHEGDGVLVPFHGIVEYDLGL